MHSRRTLAIEGLKFLVAGGLNTALTLSIYWLLLRVTDYRIAYTASYVLGVAASYLLNSLFVFGTRPAIRSALAFPLVYVAQYIIGLGALWLWVEGLHLPQAWGVLAVVVVTMPMTFVLSRFVLRRFR